MKLYQNVLHVVNGASDAAGTSQYQFGLLQTRIPTNQVDVEYSNPILLGVDIVYTIPQLSIV